MLGLPASCGGGKEEGEVRMGRYLTRGGGSTREEDVGSLSGRVRAFFSTLLHGRPILALLPPCPPPFSPPPHHCTHPPCNVLEMFHGVRHGRKRNESWAS